MTTTKREARIVELNYLAQEWNCTFMETLAEYLYHFYKAAGFWSDVLDAELKSLSNDELIEAYLNI